MVGDRLMKKILLIILATLSLSLLAAVNAIHVMPSTYLPGVDLEMMVEVTQGNDDISAVKMQYRVSGDSKWLETDMRQDEPGFWRASIPRSYYSTSEVEYRFQFELLSGVKEYLPDENSLDQAYAIGPIGMQGTQGTHSDAFVLLSDDSSISSDDDYLLAVSYIAIADELDPNTLQIFVDDRDVTKLAEKSGSTLVYREEKPREGIKKALVKAVVNGKELYSDTWITQVVPGEGGSKLPISFRGSVNMSANSYSTSDKDVSFGNTLSDFAAWTDLYAQYGILDLSTNVYVSSLEKSSAQPVNRYTFGVELPFMEAHFGDSSPQLSEYTMNGKNIRGIYSSIGTRSLRLYLAHGETVRMTKNEGDGSVPKTGTFKQEAAAARLVMGSEQGFSLGLTGTRHRDVRSSLDSEYYEYINPATNLKEYSTKAQDNGVIAVDAKLNVPDQHVLMGAEVAASLLNKNTLPGAMSEEDLQEYSEDIDVNPQDVSDWFIINQNIEPFGLDKSNIAWKVYLRAYMMNNMITVDYQEVGSSFTALGTHAPLSDSRIVTMTDQFNLGRAFLLTGSYSQTVDNLMEHSTETNTYSNLQAQAILRLSKMPYLKASLLLNNSENEANTEIDSLDFTPYTGDNQQLSFGIGYNFIQIPYVPTQLDLSYRMGEDSREIGSPDVRATTLVSDNGNSGINFSMSNRFLPIPLKTYLAYSTSSNENKLLDTETKNSRIYMKAEYSLFSDILKPYLSFSNTSLSGDQDESSYSVTSLGLTAYPMRNLSVNTDLALKKVSNKDNSAAEYDTTTWRLLVSQRF